VGRADRKLAAGVPWFSTTLARDVSNAKRVARPAVLVSKTETRERSTGSVSRDKM
jgi:hypothetical protein